MYRLIEELNAKGKSEWKVYGVLTDYDLSSWRKDLETDYTRTSKQRTGTPPYMAYELLQGKSSTHLYRHDLESLFYIMMLTAAHHTIDLPKSGPSTRGESGTQGGDPPYQEWFKTQNYSTLGSIKQSFLLSSSDFSLSPAFESFRSWLKEMLRDFTKGFHSKNHHSTIKKQEPNWREKRAAGFASEATSTPVPFNDETLNGCVDYSTIIEPTRSLKGELKGLIIHYDIEAV